MVVAAYHSTKIRPNQIMIPVAVVNTVGIIVPTPCLLQKTLQHQRRCYANICDNGTSQDIGTCQPRSLHLRGTCMR